MEHEDLIERLTEFLSEFYKNDLITAVAEGKKSVMVDFSLIDKFDIELADWLLENPENTIAAAEDSVRQIDTGLADAKVRLRFANIPESREIRIRNMRAEHIAKLIVIDGFVRRASEVRPEISEALFQCAECGSKISVIQTDKVIRSPLECDSCNNKRDFKLVEQKLYDARWVLVEEPTEVTSGERPSSVMVYLKEDLTTPKMQNRTDPGNRIKIVGVLKELPRRFKGTKSRQMDIYVDANYVESIETEWEELEISNEDEQKIIELANDPTIYKKLVGSIAPAIYGHEEEKEAISLQLFGGEARSLRDGTRVRGDIHLLLVGDPSTAKSAMMKVVSGLIPRGKYVSGKGVTAAGLTATVTKDEDFLGGWVLEAGALVMCNRSLICIDEFEKVEKDDQVALHEAMEQQSYHPKLEILLANGKKLRIGDFVERLFEKHNDKIIEGVDCEILPVKHLKENDTRVISTDMEKVFEAGIDSVSRHKAPEKFVKITFSNGREILVTPEHPVFVFEDSIKTMPAIETRSGIFVPAPRRINLQSFDFRLRMPEKFGRKKVILPNLMSADIGNFLGYFVSEGYSYSGSSKEIGLSNTSPPVISSIRNSVKNVFGAKTLDYTSRNRTQRLVSSSVFDFMTSNFPQIMRLSREKRIPPQLFATDEKILRVFLNSAFEGDGSTENEAVCYRTASKGLAEDYQDALLRLGLFSRIIFDKNNASYKVYITGDSLENFSKIVLQKKYGKIDKLIKRSKRSLRHHDVLPSHVGKEIRNLLKEVGLVYTGYFNNHLKSDHAVTRDVFDGFAARIKRKAEKIRKSLKTSKTFKELRTNANYSQQYVAGLLQVKRGKVDYIERGGYNEGEREKFFEALKRRIKEKVDSAEEKLDGLTDLKNLRWLRIKKVEILKNQGEIKTKWVYDITIKPTQAFIGSGVVLHNSVSIAKANIVATLPARTSVLAGGNPKLGRFDPYLPIKEQVDIPETLLSRFDLKFALRDLPNPETDAKIAEHIMRARFFAEAEAEPAIGPDMIKKYVAYVRKNCRPKMSQEAADELKNFYLTLRGRSGEESPIAITPRQYEALIRLSEASAKVRLSNMVMKEDSARAINLMKASLRQFGFEPETGKIDIDRAEGQRATAAQRSRIRVMIDVIDDLAKSHGRDIPVDQILKQARQEGLDAPDDILRKMLNEGLLFSPRQGVINKL